MAKETSELVKHPTTVEEAIESKEIKAAICRGIFRITRLREPVTPPRDSASRNRLDWQDVYGEIVLKLIDPAVGFAEANFSPAYAYGIAKNTAGKWLRDRMKERPRRRKKSVVEQEVEKVAFQTMQFDPQLESKDQPDPEKNMLDTKAIEAREDFLASLALDFAKDVLERFAEMYPENHVWLIEYLTTRRIKKHTAADHQRAARLCKKLRELYDVMKYGDEDDLEQAELEDDDLEVATA